MIQLQIIFKGLRMSFKIFSTFTGAGGLDIGFHGDFNFLDTYYPKLNFTTNLIYPPQHRHPCLTEQLTCFYRTKNRLLQPKMNQSSIVLR